jgi:hypothetical protein
MMGRIGALIAIALCVAAIPASTAPAGEVTLTATSANVSEGGSPVKIQILRWSTDEERTPVIAALNAPPPVAAPNPAAGRGVAGLPASLPAGAGANTSAAAGRGRGRGARGRGGPAVPLTPIAALTAAIGKAPTLGYIWTSDITGYSIKYARQVALPDGGERIILATDRRLGAYAAAWKPASSSVTDYEFTLIEIRMNSNGSGEGKTSLTTNVIADAGAKTIALDDYAAAPAILKNVTRDTRVHDP